MTSSSVFSIISKIKEHAGSTGYFEKEDATFLYDYMFGLNDLRKKIYISAEIRPDSLENGSDLSDEAREYARLTGVSGDRPAQFIGKQLGGVGDPRNVFPLNAELDTGAWKEGEKQVYMHLKKGGNRHAHLIYGIEINKFFKDELSRPYKIHYYFQLFENGQIIGHAIEGVFENTSPKITKKDYCRDNYGNPCPYPFQDGFKFEPYTVATIPSPFED